MLRRQYALSMLAGLVAIGPSLGCSASTELEYENFKERYEILRPDPTGNSDCMMIAAAGEADGDYFMTMSASLAPDRPANFLTTLTTEDSSEGLALTMSLQPLNSADRMTPVQSPIELTALVARDGSYETSPVDITLDPEASPLDSLLATEQLVFSGSLCLPNDSLCGTMDGMLTMPINSMLTDSTFAMVRVDGPEDYPEPPPINCAGDLAKPL